MPSFTARLPKTAHDMHQSVTFTCSTGMELPIYRDMLLPGDKIKFTATEFARINNIIKPALCNVDFHLDYFFVPVTVICNYAGSFLWKTDDLINGRYNAFDSADFPVIALNRYFVDEFVDASSMNFSQLCESIPNAAGTNVDSFSSSLISGGFDAFGKGVYRLLDLLGYNPQGVFRKYYYDDTNHTFYTGSENLSVTPWYLCAYQAIHQLYFRNDDREPKSYCYNFDKFYDSPEIDELRDVTNMLKLRYVQRERDYFQSVKVSPLASPVSLLSMSTADGSTTELLAKVNNYLDGSDLFVSDAALDGQTLGPKSTQVQGTAVTTGAIRSMFAVEKMLRIIGRTQKTYEAQVLAHFGKKVPHDVLHNITHIGHDMATMSPEVVIAQSDTFNGTTGQSLGSVGGQGSVKFTGKPHTFEAPCHGFFMVIAHCIPKPRYIVGFDKSLVLNNPLDFPQPEYDKLGMQPLFAYEGSTNFIGTPQRMGWQFRYEQFKRKYDRASMAFLAPSSGVNEMSAWVLSQSPFRNEQLLLSNHPYSLMADGAMLDNISVVKYNAQFSYSNTMKSTPWLLYQYDPFICDFTLQCTKLSIMSKYGEPDLD